MRILGPLMAAALAVLLFIGSMGVAKAKEQDTFGGRVVESLFNSGGFSFYFDIDIAVIADSYVSKTKFAGKVRINQPLRGDYLNIYVFNRGNGFSYDRFLRNTCRAFGDVNAIVCDHNFLDSMPASMPVLFKGGSDRIPPPALMYWAIGHEIGHLILGHSASSFAAIEAAEAARAINSDQPGAISARTPAQQELDADLFAASGLPISNHMDWIYFGNPIVDAFWAQLSEKSKELTTPEGPERVLVNYDSTGHPALIERTYRLLRALEAIFTSADSITQLVERVEFVVDGSVGQEYADTFFGEVYLGSADGVDVHRRRLTDLAVQMVFTGPRPSEKMSDAICVDKTGEVSDVHWLEQVIICGYDTTVGASLRSCIERPKEEVLRCISLIPLLDEVCERDGSSRSNLCSDRAGTSDSIRTAVASGVELPDDVYFLSKWAFPAIYKYMQRNHILHREQLSQVTSGLARIQGLPRSASVRTELMLLHATVVEGDPSVDWAELANLSIAVASHGEFVDDDLLALNYQRRAVELIEREMPDSVELAFHKMRLAGIMRTVGVHIMGSNDGLVGSMSAEQLAEALTDSSNAMRSESGSLAEAAASIYHRSLIQLEAEPRNEEAINAGRISYINALSGAVFSYNMSLEPEKALKVSQRLMKEIEAHPELYQVDTFERRTLVPALENIATAHVQARAGEPKFAIQVIGKALAILNSPDDETILTKRIASYAFYKNRDWIDAVRMAREFITEFEEKSLRKYDLDGAMLVSGLGVTSSEIFQTVLHR